MRKKVNKEMISEDFKAMLSRAREGEQTLSIQEIAEIINRVLAPEEVESLIVALDKRAKSNNVIKAEEVLQDLNSINQKYYDLP